MKPKVLFVGCHPFRHGGNSHFMACVLDNVDAEKFDVVVFAGTPRGKGEELRTHRFPIIEGSNDKIADYYGDEKLLESIQTVKPDIVFFVGVDLWTYFRCFPSLLELKRRQRFKWASWFPYDVTQRRDDWNKWVEAIDFPFSYSEYGYNMLKDDFPRVRYARPLMYDADKFVKYNEAMQAHVRRLIFPTLKDTDFLFGMNINNQFRKDPLRAIRAFFEVKKKHPNVKLYLHSELQGSFNLQQYIKDKGGVIGDVLAKKQGKEYSTSQMVDIYNSMDCYLSTSLQEGLNWTVIEAMLCGTPLVISDNTAHTELCKLAGIEGVKCDEMAFVSLVTESGPMWVETAACNFDDLVDKMCKQVEMGRHKTSTEAGEKWIASVSDINDMLGYIAGSNVEVLNRVLFAQHSSAGDVLMTTRCLEGLKARYNLPIDYMTSPQYMDIVQGNPLIDNVLPWDEVVAERYLFVVNPHGERILPGHWGRNSNSLLADFYWKILKVKPNPVMINKKYPENLPFDVRHAIQNVPFVVVHTTGGDAEFRTYKYMGDVVYGLKQRGWLTVQLGGEGDYPADADIDLRGRLSFQETAWVMDEAAYAITVDSFISHLAGFLEIPQVCLFGSGNHNVVKPVGTVICMVPDYVQYCKGLGPCSASVRDCPVKCTGLHDPLDIISAFDNLVKGEVR